MLASLYTKHLLGKLLKCFRFTESLLFTVWELAQHLNDCVGLLAVCVLLLDLILIHLKATQSVGALSGGTTGTLKAGTTAGDAKHEFGRGELIWERKKKEDEGYVYMAFSFVFFSSSKKCWHTSELFFFMLI